MMNVRLFHQSMVTALMAGLILSGCLTKASAPARFYMIGSSRDAAEKPPAQGEAGQTVIVVETVKIARYLNRNQIVTSANGTEYTINEFHQWAEPLEDNLTRVLAENLSALTSDHSAQVFPAAPAIRSAYRVDVEVLRLDGELGEDVTLGVRWAILDTEADEVVALTKSEYREETGEDSYESYVLAESEAVGKLSQDIAEKLQTLLISGSDEH